MTLIGRFATWWRDRRHAAARLREVEACGPEECARMAHDCGLSCEELMLISRYPDDSARLLPPMLQAYGIDIAAVRANHPGVVQHMQVACTHCESKARCAADLDGGASATHVRDYCPNAEVFEVLRLRSALTDR